MSSTDTKWKKKIKGINNKEGLENKAENGKTTRDEKDEAQTKMLDELKNRLRNIQNKRKGFTKLPHLTDIKDESDHKEEFKEGQTNEGEDDDESTNEGEDDDESTNEGEDDDESTVEKEGIANNNNNKYPHGVILFASYITFLITYLQLYHLNFKESIKSNFPKSYPPPVSDNGVTADNTTEDELPHEWGAISANILDSLSKTIGSYVWSDDYIKIEHNLFLKNMNRIARFGMKYLFIPSQVVVAITQNLIPNLALVPGINKITFPLIFILLFLAFYGATFTNKIDGVSEIRNYADNKKWEGWDVFVKYYAMIPVSYFVMVAIIIIIAYGLDLSKEASEGTFFKDGLFAAIAKSLVAIFSISMSVVLSGFSAIPLGLFAFLWIVFPEGGGKPPGEDNGEDNDIFKKFFDLFGLTKWSNAIRDNYLIPEWDVCEESQPTKWARYIIRKLWNNKILISFFLVLDSCIKIYIGKGNYNIGKELYNENLENPAFSILVIVVPFILIFLFNLDLFGWDKFKITREYNSYYHLLYFIIALVYGIVTTWYVKSV